MHKRGMHQLGHGAPSPRNSAVPFLSGPSPQGNVRACLGLAAAQRCTCAALSCCALDVQHMPAAVATTCNVYSCWDAGIISTPRQNIGIPPHCHDLRQAAQAAPHRMVSAGHRMARVVVAEADSGRMPRECVAHDCYPPNLTMDPRCMHDSNRTWLCTQV